MVPNQRLIVVSDWGSFLGSHFPHCCLWDLVYIELPECTHVASRVVWLFLLGEFQLIKIMWNSTHAAPWSPLYDNRDSARDNFTSIIAYLSMNRCDIQNRSDSVINVY